jgi:hypothetical protein
MTTLGIASMSMPMLDVVLVSPTVPHAASTSLVAPPVSPTTLSVPHVATTPPSCFTQPLLFYQWRHPTPVLVHSHAESLVYHPVVVAHDPRIMHSMVTCHVARISIIASPPLSPILPSILSALADLHLCHAMEEEYKALLSNNTWHMVPQSSGATIVTCKWIFMHKFKADGTLDWYKADGSSRGSPNVPVWTMMRLSASW